MWCLRRSGSVDIPGATKYIYLDSFFWLEPIKWLWMGGSREIKPNFLFESVTASIFDTTTVLRRQGMKSYSTCHEDYFIVCLLFDLIPLRKLIWRKTLECSP